MRRACGQQRREVWRAEGLLCDTSLPRAILEIRCFSYWIPDWPRRCRAISWGRLRMALPRSRMSSIMSRNAALAASSRSSSNLIVIQAPGISARSDLRWRSERIWNSNGPVSAASIAVKHGSAWTYQGGLQLNYSLHPRRPATASRAKLRHRRSPAFSFIPTNTHQRVRVSQAGTCRTFDPL